MYVFDNNAFGELGHFYPGRFPTIWEKVDALAERGKLTSVREVRREIERNFPFEHVIDWVKVHSDCFRTPGQEELHIVKELMSTQVGRELIKKRNILNGFPSADPFIIAAGAVLKATVVTQEELKPNAARIPWFCKERGIACINVEAFFEREGIRY